MKPHLLVLSAIILFAAGCGKEDCWNGLCVEGDYHWEGDWRDWRIGYDSTRTIDDTSEIRMGSFPAPGPEDMFCRGAYLRYAGERDYFFKLNFNSFYVGD